MNGIRVCTAYAVGLLASVLVIFSSSASATTVFLDNFENGNSAGWLGSTTGGSGSIGVELHNSSKMAFVQHTGSGLHSLSMDFSYVSSETLSFDMHAVANAVSNRFGDLDHSISAVSLSFLNIFNQSLGSLRLVNASTPAFLVAHDIPVDQVQHNYSVSMGDYAALVGLGSANPIAKLSLSFFSVGQTDFFRANSNAKVWFDNVTITRIPTTIPIPATLPLLLFGVAGLGLIERKRQSA